MGFLPWTPAQYDSGEPAMMMGPNSSGRMAASIITAHPAWQLPITQGFPSASGWSAATFSRKIASARAISSMVWPGTGSGEDPVELAGWPCFDAHADCAAALEPANPGAMPGARVDDDERPARGVEFDSRGRNHSHETVVDRPIKRFATEDQLHVVVEYV